MKIHSQKLINIYEIKPYAKNSRLHSTEQIEQIKESIKHFGFTNPLLINENNELIAGHGRLEAIKQLNKVDFKANPILKIPCVIVSDLSINDYKALIIADNKIALNASWDFEILENELKDLLDSNFEINEINLTGFDLNELDFLNELENQDDLEAEKENIYTDKITTPIYEIKGIKPDLAELCNSDKTFDFLKKIELANIQDNALKEFLKLASYRFLEFDFAKIAEFYAQSDKDTQELFEALLLVFIDYDSALERGYIRLTELAKECAK